jgi:hypothetical protein
MFHYPPILAAVVAVGGGVLAQATGLTEEAGLPIWFDLGTDITTVGLSAYLITRMAQGHMVARSLVDDIVKTAAREAVAEYRRTEPRP